MSDYRDLPLEVARRAAGFDPDAPRPPPGVRDRWENPRRGRGWVWWSLAIAAVAVVALLLWRPIADRVRADAPASASASASATRPAPATAPAAAAIESAPTRVPEAAAAPAAAGRDSGRATTAGAPRPGDQAPATPTPGAGSESSGTRVAPGSAAPTATSGDRRDGDEAAAARDDQADALRERADEDLRRGRLEPAAEGYRALLARPGEDPAAEEGLARVAAEHAARAQRLAADFEFDGAERELAAARALAPTAAATHAAARDLARARAARARIPTMADASRQRRVRSLLDQAAAAMARGDLMDPPGESAYDKIAAARALAPDSVEVRSATLRLERARRDQGEAPPPPPR